MRLPLCAILFLLMATMVDAETIPMPPSFDIKAAEGFANLALACVHKEYPLPDIQMECAKRSVFNNAGGGWNQGFWHTREGRLQTSQKPTSGPL